MFQKILFPLDGSETSERAIPYAIEMATKHNAKILLLNTYQIPAEVEGSDESYIQELTDKLRTNSQAVLNKIKEELSSKNLEAYVLVKQGKAGPVILDVMENEKCDLIIMGSRGLGSVKGMLVGSVSHHVIHNNKTCPVMIVY